MLSAYDRIAEMPTIGVARDYGNPAFVGMRMWPIPGFPNHLIFYMVIDDEVHVLHVLHGAQDLPRIFETE